MRTLFDDACRTDVLARLKQIRPAAQPPWGQLTAPRMVAHLADQMRMTLGNTRSTGFHGPKAVSSRRVWSLSPRQTLRTHSYPLTLRDCFLQKHSSLLPTACPCDGHEH
jgi:hypothetical protein